MVAKSDITGLILAGGAGRRVERRDKGLIEWHGQPLIYHVSRCLRDQVGELLISCNRNIETYRQYASTTVSDTRSDFQGPLAGLEAAAPYIQSDFLAIVACDTPQLPNNLVERLMSPLSKSNPKNPQISYVFDGEREQYLCAVMRRECLDTLGAFLDKGQRAVWEWYRTLRSVPVDFSTQQQCFNNYNRIN